MEQFYLEKVTLERKNEIINYIKEFYKYNSNINGVGRLQDFVNQEKEEFEMWFSKICKETKSDFPKICYIFIRKNDNRLIGMVNIRMTSNLKEYPYGHIGYSIRPTERNKGYGKLQFYLALKEMQKYKIDICQMNCEKNNKGSKSIIKALGGKLEKRIDDEEYYLIDIKKSIKDNFNNYDKFTCTV